MGFLPTGPITIFSAVVIWTIAVSFLIFGKRDKKLIGAAFIISWIGARASTAFEEPLWTVSAVTISALLCFNGFTFCSRAIATLYGIRLVLISGLGFGFWDWFLLWELNRVFLYLQILIAVGTIGGTGGKLVGRFMGDSGSIRRPYNYMGLPSQRYYSDKNH